MAGNKEWAHEDTGSGEGGYSGKICPGGGSLFPLFQNVWKGEIPPSPPPEAANRGEGGVFGLFLAASLGLDRGENLPRFTPSAARIGSGGVRKPSALLATRFRTPPPVRMALVGAAFRGFLVFRTPP